jgi:hypothetical protein
MPKVHVPSEKEKAAAIHYWPEIILGMTGHGIPRDTDLARDLVWILMGILSRETHFGHAPGYTTPGQPDGTGDRGHGHGLFQIDDRSHSVFLATGGWKEVATSCRYVLAEVLAPSIRYLDRHGLVDPLLTIAAIAAYNAGPARVRQAVGRGDSPDRATTGGDYSADVLRRAEWYRAFITPYLENGRIQKVDLQ